MSDEATINEWLLDEYGRTKAALKDLMRRHEEVLNHLADVCRRNDRMEAAGDRLRDLLDMLVTDLETEGSVITILKDIDDAIQKWGEANV